jgi:hypothetical protein
VNQSFLVATSSFHVASLFAYANCVPSQDGIEKRQFHDISNFAIESMRKDPLAGHHGGNSCAGLGIHAPFPSGVRQAVLGNVEAFMLGKVSSRRTPTVGRTYSRLRAEPANHIHLIVDSIVEQSLRVVEERPAKVSRTSGEVESADGMAKNVVLLV